jgi:hypothetical protein
MTAAGPPDGQTFAGWLRQFAPHRPNALAAARFPLVTVQAAMRVRRASAADPLTRLLLSSVPDPGGAPAATLRRWVPLEPNLLEPLLAEMAGRGLLAAAGGRLALTISGRRARDVGALAIVERRVFRFLDLRPVAPPAFLPAPGWPAPTSLVPRADRQELLHEALARPEKWKRDCGFPLDVEGFASLDEVGVGEAWRLITVVRVATICAAVVGTGHPEPGWLVYPARPESWSVEEREPILRLPGEAIATPSHEAILATLHDWCREKKLGVAADACLLERNGLDASFTLPSRNTLPLPRETWLAVAQGPWCWGFQLKIR